MPILVEYRQMLQNVLQMNNLRCAFSQPLQRCEVVTLTTRNQVKGSNSIFKLRRVEKFIYLLSNNSIGLKPYKLQTNKKTIK